MIKEKVIQLREFYLDNRDNLCQEKPLPDFNEYVIPELYHYTSLSALFDILESDSLWFSGLRFSNDSSDEILLGKDWLFENKYFGDNFIFCIGVEKDLLSQWRGYCPNGGASIGFDVAQFREYSVLYDDFDNSKKHIDVNGRAFPVLYTPNTEGAQLIARTVEEILCEDKKTVSRYSLLKLKDFIPYIKHSAFCEEREFRLLFSNSERELSKCIRFRKLRNGTKLPYIVVKSECVDESHETIIDISEEHVKKIIDDSEYYDSVEIPVCKNQSELCSSVRSYIMAHPELTGDSVKIRVFCKRHLPIRSIMIAPMPEQNRIKEQVASFCRSKYWLSDVDVRVSDIPYVPSINN